MPGLYFLLCHHLNWDEKLKTVKGDWEASEKITENIKRNLPRVGTWSPLVKLSYLANVDLNYITIEMEKEIKLAQS